MAFSFFFTDLLSRQGFAGAWYVFASVLNDGRLDTSTRSQSSPSGFFTYFSLGQSLVALALPAPTHAAFCTCDDILCTCDILAIRYYYHYHRDEGVGIPVGYVTLPSHKARLGVPWLSA